LEKSAVTHRVINVDLDGGGTLEVLVRIVREENGSIRTCARLLEKTAKFIFGMI